MQWAKQKQPGFTIVELLIVIVVIAILAAITIVAYNGIQNRAKQSAAQTAASQAARKIMTYAVQNNDDYPPSLAAAGITDETGLEYSYDNTVTPHKFGVTATNGTFSYYVSNASTSPTAGGYEGHGQGGVAAVNNLSLNPSFEANITGVNVFGATNSWGSSGAASGTRFLRSTRAVASGSSGPWWNAANVEVGKSYRVSLSMRGNVAAAREVNIEWMNSSGAMVTRSTIATPTVTTSWAVYTGNAVVAPAGATVLRLSIYTPASSTGALTDYADFDATMITEGSTQYAFADGNTLNWVWKGAVNNSPSVGPQL